MVFHVICKYAFGSYNKRGDLLWQKMTKTAQIAKNCPTMKPGGENYSLYPLARTGVCQTGQFHIMIFTDTGFENRLNANHYRIGFDHIICCACFIAPPFRRSVYRLASSNDLIKRLIAPFAEFDPPFAEVQSKQRAEELSGSPVAVPAHQRSLFRPSRLRYSPIRRSAILVCASGSPSPPESSPYVSRSGYRAAGRASP